MAQILSMPGAISMEKIISISRGEIGGIVSAFAAPLSPIKSSFFVKRSKIHSWGLFAEKDLVAGSLIHKFDASSFPTTKISEILLWPKHKREKFLHYAFQGGIDFYYGNFTVLNNDSSFLMNHHCDPNCAYVSDEELVALRDIKKNEELTLDYATIMAPTGLEEPFRCNCTSKDCRRQVTRFDCLKHDVQMKYGNKFLSFIRRHFIDVTWEDKLGQQ